MALPIAPPRHETSDGLFASLYVELSLLSKQMPAYLYFLLVFGTAFWGTPFFLVRNKGQAVVKRDKRGRWGILLQCLAYSILWQGRFWEGPPVWWRVAASCALFMISCIVSWTAARALDRQFRFDAALDSAHTLVRSGPYRYVRHPIYTSMLCILLATGSIVSPLRLMLVSIVVFLCGALIRIRIEDGLLESQFGPEFVNYRQHVPAMLPFL
jgi:protein-S-isoprenylcysteine O-methyltransferase Ste14